jgi:hypothetical protein
MNLRPSASHVLAPAAVILVLTSTVVGQATWHRRWPSSAPPVRQYGLMAFDESRAEVLLLFGIADQGVLRNDFWRWDGNWTQIQTSLPPLRRETAMAFDAGRQRLVLFGGGQNNGPALQDLWEWDGTQWAARTPASSPSPRMFHSLAYDRDHGLILMFGGSAATGLQNDTWTWNGNQWSQRSPAHLPSPRNIAAMAFDPAGGGVLLYGGNTQAGVSDETWTWNGSDWLMRTPSTPPFLRGKTGIVADLHRGRVVLFGGSNSDNTTWEWDGAEWHDFVLPAASPRSAPSMAYDTARRETILFGGLDPLVLFVNDTWTYSTPTPASYTAYGSGCAGSVGVPLLANRPYVLPWLGDSFTARASNLAPAVAAVFFATGLASTPPQSLAAFGMPGCDALLQPAVAELRLAAAGAADWTFAIPNTPSLAGVHLFQQAFALEAGANATGIVVSNGAELVTGIR